MDRNSLGSARLTFTFGSGRYRLSVTPMSRQSPRKQGDLRGRSNLTVASKLQSSTKDENLVNTMTSPSQEFEQLRRELPELQISSATDDFITASYGRTAFTTVRATLTFPEGYPNTHPLIVAIQASDVVPPGLKKKLEKDLGKAASESNQGESQVCAVLGRLKQFIDTNRFVPCWKELKQCVDLVGKSDGGKLAMNETSGKIVITLQSQKYHYKFSIVIDESYPSTSEHINYGKPCALKMTSTNFPPKIEKLLTSQAMELIRRLQDGMAVEDAVQMSNPTHLPKDYRGNHADGVTDGPRVRLTNDTLKNLKHDVETLSLVRDLREVDSATKQGDPSTKAFGKKDRKDARRAVGKITASEVADDALRNEREKQWQQHEAQRMAGYNFTEHDGSNPQPSLLAVVSFLSREVSRITCVNCPICFQSALPKDPSKLKALYQSHAEAKTEKEKKARRLAKQQRPERVYCGCWYHHKCLDKYMTEPPFGAECAKVGCDRGRIYHPDWPANVKELERAWAGKQARAREIEDAAMFL